MHREARLALLLLLGHIVVNMAHGVAHWALAIPLTRSQELFILLVIVIAPLAAGVLIWRGSRFAGPLVLAASLAGALLFGVWNHFVALSPDHVSHLLGAASPGWRILFHATAILLVPTEGLGCWAGLRMLKGPAGEA